MLVKLGAMFVIPFCLMALANADAPAQPKTIKVFIRPECKGMFYGPDFVDVDPSGRAVAEKRIKPSYLPWDSSRAKSMVFKDPHTGISFYVESDGRHLAAISPEGGLLWVRNPFEDRHLCQYRTPRPVIDRMEAADSGQHVISIRNWNGDVTHDVLFLQFDSSQYGVIDQITGDFYPEGQN
jgi:hypothetical protein